jgi:hypothetical protein
MQLLFPFTYGDAIASPMLPDSPSAFPEIASGYAGIAAAVLALLVLRRGRRSPESVALAVLAAAGVLIAAGQWPLFEAASEVPLLRLVVPLRFLTWAALSVPLLAALEIDRYARDAAAGARPWRALALSGSAAHAQAGGLAFQVRALAAACAVAVVLAAAGLALRRRTAVLCGVAAALAALELLVDARHLYRAAPSADLFPETPLVAFLRARGGVFRTAGAGGALFSNTNVFARAQDVRTHDPLERRDYLDFLDESCGYPPDEYFRSLRRLDCAALDFLNVRYLVASPGAAPPSPKWSPAYAGADGTVFENASALPRAFAPARVRFAPRVSARDAARLGDWTREAILEDAAAREAAPNAPVRVEAYEEGVDRVALRTSSTAPGILVASLVQDGGWSARDEAGRRLRTWRANGPFLAFEAPVGERRIVLTYTPPGSAWGLLAAAASLGAGAAWCLRRRSAVSAERPRPAAA